MCTSQALTMLRDRMADETVVVRFAGGGRRTRAIGSRVNKGVDSFTLRETLLEFSVSSDL
jgi:hypothetical protein